MKQSIVFFTDPGKDGDDLLATIHLLMQAKAAGIIPLDMPIKLVTTDEIPCEANGKQNPRGQYGLRALYLNMHLAKLQQELSLPSVALPEIIPGAMTAYYQYDESKQKYYSHASESDAFYPSEEVEHYYASEKAPESCLLSPEDKPNLWIEKLKQATTDGASLVNIAAFNGVADFLAQISQEDQQKFNLLTMGYNQPYSKDEYETKIKNPNTLPYNARSTDSAKATTAVKTLVQIPANFHVVSGTTRSLAKYDQNSWLSSFMEIMSRSYPLLTQQYSTSLLSAMVEFVKHSKYKAFWPHDVVPSLMMLIEQGNWETMGLPGLKKEMLFTQIEKVPAQQLRMRIVNDSETNSKTGVLVDTTVPPEPDDVLVGNEDQFFTYGKELDVVFFTSLLHYVAIQALPETEKKPLAGLSEHYKAILHLKAQLYTLKQDSETNKTTLLELEQQIKSTWALVCFKELRQQLTLLVCFKELQQQLPLQSKDVLYVLGSQSPTFSLHQFTVEQARSLNELITAIIDWSGEKETNLTMLNEDLLKWIKALAEFMQVTQNFLTEEMLSDLKTALKQVSLDKKLDPLTAALFYRLREQLIPDTVLPLLKQNGNPKLKQEGKLGLEFKRTGNSLIYALLALKGNLSIPFPTGIHGMSAEYKTLLTLEKHSKANQLAFVLHLAIHDAGKGDIIKSAVKMNDEGIYFVHLPDNNYYQLNPVNNEVSPCDEVLFNTATAHVDHDAALQIYGIVGGKAKQCSPTEFLVWGASAPEEINKEAISICDELIPLCNEMNIAQIVQGEIPFAGIKKGLDLFFEAYRRDSKKAELVFVHHCYDIFGAAPLDLFASRTGKDPELHLKIELLYQTLLSVAQEPNIADPSAEAYHRYRQQLAAAIPEILTTENAARNNQTIIAKTRLGQMLRCHLFKTVTSKENGQITIAEEGHYEPRTQLFVESIDEAFNLLSTDEQLNLIERLNRNVGSREKAAVMVMYGPKLLLTATTGAEFSDDYPKDKTIIAKRLAPMLRLYVSLYDLQAQHSTPYGVIDVNNLALIVEKLFTWYQASTDDQKQSFAKFLFTLQETDKANDFALIVVKLFTWYQASTDDQKQSFVKLLFTIQETGKANEFLTKLGDIKDKPAPKQLTQLKETLAAFDLPFEVSEAGLVVKQKPAAPIEINESSSLGGTKSVTKTDQEAFKQQPTLRKSTPTLAAVTGEIDLEKQHATNLPTTTKSDHGQPKKHSSLKSASEQPAKQKASPHKVQFVISDSHQLKEIPKAVVTQSIPLEESTVPVENKANPVEEIKTAIKTGKDKHAKQQLLINHVRSKEELSIGQLNEIFVHIQNNKELNEALNSHRNPHLDRFFGIKNTTSWRDTLKELRNIAFNSLCEELYGFDNNTAKLELLDYAKKLPVFWEHRNNSVLTGAWGRTETLRDIEELERGIREDKDRQETVDSSEISLNFNLY